jgi:hypothetical protein
MSHALFSLHPARGHLSKAARLFTALLIIVSLMGGPATRIRAATTITFTGEEQLGTPTDTSITINIVPGSTIEYHYQYGTESGSYPFQTGNATATASVPHETVITGLTANTQYFYRMRYHLPGETDWVERTQHSFWTQRAAGSTYVFTVTSDAHGNAGSTTMNNILSELPDFDVDLGDTFMVDNAGSETQSAVNTRYLNFREPTYFDRIGHSVPIFLSSGNHEEEEGWNLDDSPSRSLLSIQARKWFYPTPVDQGVGGFYSGNTDPLAAIDEGTYGDEYREDYYAWTWGDALFVVIDPFQYTMTMPYPAIAGEESDETVVQDQWLWTLGTQQYNWLKQTLEDSTARYKFMFSHQMVGGIPDNSVSGGAGYVRGGAEAAGYFEWGGKNFDGTEGFAAHRAPADFPSTIHQLMVDNHVSAYFHGHDHQYVYETRDGIVYQEVPSPSMAGGGFGSIYAVGTYADYETIAICPNSGHLKITITPDLATVEYVRSTTGSCTPSNFSLSYTMAPYISGPTHNLTTAVDPTGGGTINPSAGTHSYAENAVVNVTATPGQWYDFDHWSGACTGNGACSVTMDADKSVTAHFVAIPTHTLTVAVDPTGGGTTNPTVGVHTYEAGDGVNVTASANPGFTFDYWTGACTGSGACSVTLDADKSVTAHFASITYDLTVAVNPTGAGTTNPTAGVHNYAYGTVVNITQSPNTGYAFSSWGGDCSGSGSCSVTMTANRNVTANYTAVTGNVASAATPSDTTLTAGESVVVTINVDMSGMAAPNNALGSFTGSLAWNPAILAFDSYSGPLGGFTGAVNTAQAGSGLLSFNGANATGATGNTVTFQFTLHAIGAGSSALDLEYSAMAAATTFTSLLPQLIITDGQVTVSAGKLGDVNGDGVVNSTDALIVLSADADINTSQFCPMNCGDVNGDTRVNSTDALIILSYDAQMSVPFPVGTGACPSTVNQPPGCS